MKLRWRNLTTRLLLFAALCTGDAAMAADRALLIGVNDYPFLPRRLWLHGPGNDVALMREVLLARGFDAGAIRTLASRGTAAEIPTRANILAAMESLRLQVRAGDRIVLYLSGHGSQQPQPAAHAGRPTEPDGLDEVFLPADVRAWGGAATGAAIPNALLDDEIGEWMDALVDRGALVWAIFDTCHAAGLARDSRRTRWRSVSPADLGMPVASRSPVRSASTMGRTDGRVLLHAARAHELTAEEWLPRGAAMTSGRMHGVFTYHLATLWRGREKADAGQIERALGEAYRQEGRASPRPTVVGNRQLTLP